MFLIRAKLYFIHGNQIAFDEKELFSRNSAFISIHTDVYMTYNKIKSI